MICDICGNESAQVRRITETYGKGKNLLVIENIPMSELPQLRRKLFYGGDASRNRTHQAPP